MRIDAYSDSDWAGCRASRRSTSGGLLAVSGGVVKSWSSTQGTIATWSGEAEYYAAVKAAAEALGFQSLARDLGWNSPIYVYIDSSAAKSVASRVGLGKLRHLEVKYLWLQEALKARRIYMRKIRGVLNPADILTKPQSAAEMSPMLRIVNGALIRRSAGPCESEKWAEAV